MCIPLIIWSLLCILAKISRKYKLFPLQLILVTMYNLYYVSLDLQAGMVSTILYSIMVVHATFIGSKKSYINLCKINIFSWIMQFVGHYIEGSKPALIDGFITSFTIAPFFIVLDMLTYLHLVTITC